MRAIVSVGVAVAALMAATSAQAFGLRTHLYIADQVWADAQDDCHVGLGGDAVRIEATLCDALRTNRGAFLAGAIGPDAFPDLLIGQNYVHPGTPDGRQTADWLELVLNEAQTPEEIAFAYGQLIHAAGDTFAHSYVNNYAGGVFELTARWHKDVELRHFQLEKYIDQHLNYVAPLDELRVPSGLLVRSMVETTYIPGEFNLTREDLEAIRRGPRPAAGRIARLLGVKVGKAAPASHMTAMRTMLILSEEAAKDVVCDDIKATYLLASTYGDYVRAEALARGQTLVWAAGVAPTNDCSPAAVARAETELLRADALRDDLVWHDQAVNERRAWLAQLDPSLLASLASTRARYESALQRRTETKAIAAFAPQWRDDVRRAVEAYMQTSLASARVMVRGSEPFPPPEHRQRSAFQPYDAWWDCYGPVFSGDPIDAAEARCRRLESLGVDQGLSDVALQTGVGRWPRGLLFSFLRFESWVSNLRNDILLGIARPTNPAAVELGEGMLEPIKVTREAMNQTFRVGRTGQITFKCVSDFVDVDLGLLARSEGDWQISDSECRHRPAGGDGTGQYFEPQKFAPLRHAVTLGKLALVGRRDVADLARRWTNEEVAQGVESDGQRYSVILDMARSLDGSQQWQTVSLPTPTARPLPDDPPTAGAGYPVGAAPGALVSYSFDPAIDRERPGFPFYQSAELRRRGFARLFPEPYEGEILRRREFSAAWYPFKPCDGDPFRPLPDPELRTALCDPIRTQAQQSADEVRAALESAWREQLARCLGRDEGRPPVRQAGCLR